MKRLQALFIGMVLLLISPAYAADPTIEVGAHVGGDELAGVVYATGESESVYGGSLFSLAMGAMFDISQTAEAKVTFGIKFDSVGASNGDITWIRYPLNAVFLARSGQWRFGGGLTYHLSPELSGDGAASFIQADFDNAMGLLGEVSYYFSGRYTTYLGGRLTLIKYEDEFGNNVNGSSIGVVFGIRIK